MANVFKLAQSLLLSGYAELKQQATPSNPVSGNNKLYFKSDEKLYKLTSAGVETEVGSGSGTLTGPGSVTTNAIPRWLSTTSLVNSGVLIDSSDNITGAGSISAASFIPTSSTIPTNGIYLSAANTVAFATNSALAGTIGSGGAWTLGASGSTASHSINGNNANVFGNIASGQVYFGIRNANTTSTADAKLYIESGGATAGDAFIHLNNSTNNWAFGLDNSDSDAFIISQSTTLGTNNWFRLGTNGNTILKSAAAATTLTVRASDDVTVANFNVGDAYTVTLGRSGGTETHTINGLLDIKGGLKLSTTRTVTTTATVGANDCIILCNQSAAFALTLPTATDGRILIIKDISNTAATNNITVTRAASDTIDGATTFVINQNRQSIMLSGRSGAWDII